MPDRVPPLSPRMFQMLLLFSMTLQTLLVLPCDGAKNNYATLQPQFMFQSDSSNYSSSRFLTTTTTTTTTADNDNEVDCHPKGECEVCSSTDKERFQDCAITGRRQHFECITYNEDGDDIEHSMEFRICKRTPAEEEFLMMRLQMFCFLIGAIAVLSVRKQKMMTASLFDQRKRGVAQKPHTRRNSDHIQQDCINHADIELTSMEQEIVPLVDASSSLNANSNPDDSSLLEVV